jgi:hypothetical protein
MIYLYFNKEENRLYLFKNARVIAEDDKENNCECYWENIETVTGDKERGQVVAHSIREGLVAEFPLNRTVLTCIEPK